MKKRILITFGDSFTHGLQEEIDKCLEYSIGSHLSEWLGFDRYINFSLPCWGNETVWKEFIKKNPRETFRDYDVHCIFIASYFVRLTVPVDGSYATYTPNDNHPIMKEWLIENQTPTDALNEYSIQTLKEILHTFNDWNWKWVLGFNNTIDKRIFIKTFPKFNKQMLIPDTFSKGIYHGAPMEYHCKKTDHLNKEGYHYVANDIKDWILHSHKNWMGNGIPLKEDINFDYIKDNEINLTNRTPL